MIESTNIKNKNLTLFKGTHIVAVSGGIDSMVLCDILRKLNCKYVIAHVNFQLRGIESDADEKFVADYALQNQIPFYTKKINTEEYCKIHQIGIQEAARNIRYQFFYELLETHKYKSIITAHHLNDSIETFYINLCRGTGLKGLCGINTNKNNLIRPLLAYAKKEIEEYAIAENIIYRKDSSNDTDKYLRNKIRHHIIPQLEEYQSHYLQHHAQTLEYLNEAHQIYQQQLQKYLSKYFQPYQAGYKVLYKPLLKLPFAKTVLFEMLAPYGFHSDAIVQMIENHFVGNVFYSEKYRLLIDRTFYYLTEKSEPSSIDYIEINEDQNEILLPNEKLIFSKNCLSKNISTESEIAYIDQSKITFPLQLRRWRKGDYFYPLGLNKKKKISDFFTDKKMSLLDKENTWLLCHDDRIIWVVGKRMDHRYRVTESTQNILKIVVRSTVS